MYIRQHSIHYTYKYLSDTKLSTSIFWFYNQKKEKKIYSGVIFNGW